MNEGFNESFANIKGLFVLLNCFRSKMRKQFFRHLNLIQYVAVHIITMNIIQRSYHCILKYRLLFLESQDINWIIQKGGPMEFFFLFTSGTCTFFYLCSINIVSSFPIFNQFLRTH